MVERNRLGTDRLKGLNDATFWQVLLQEQSHPFQVLTALLRYTEQYVPHSTGDIPVMPDKLPGILAYLAKYRKKLPVDEATLQSVLEQSRKDGYTDPIDLGNIRLDKIDYQKLVEAVTALTVKE